MTNLQATATTDRNEYEFLDEEDERERVLIVVVGGGQAPQGATPSPTGSESQSIYAINVATVREVIGSRTVTRVPGAPVEMRGLVNVRGMVVSVLDLAACLSREADRDDAQTVVLTTVGLSAGTVTPVRAQPPRSIVLLEHGGRLLGLAVDAVRDVRPLDDVGQVQDPGNVQVLLGGNAIQSGTFVRGLASAGGEVVTLLDVTALLSRYLISSGET